MLGLCWSAAEVRIILNGNSSAAQISQKQELKSQGNRRSTLIKTQLSPRASIRNQRKEKTEKNEQLHQRIFLNDDETGLISTPKFPKISKKIKIFKGYVFDIDGQIEDSPIRDLFTLKLAANVQNREFIAHPNCQHQLQQTWLKESEPILFLRLAL